MMNPGCKLPNSASKSNRRGGKLPLARGTEPRRSLPDDPDGRGAGSGGEMRLVCRDVGLNELSAGPDGCLYRND